MSSDDARARAWLAAITEASSDAIVGHSADGVITSYNGAAERLYGRTSEEVLGKSSALLRAQGPVETRHAPVRDDDGLLLGTVSIARLAPEPGLELKRRLESVAQLAGGVAHDFNNLLGIIVNYASFVDDDLPQGSQAKADIEEIRRAAARAAELTRRLMLFSHRDTVDPERIDLHPFTLNLQDRLRGAAGESVDVEITAGEDLWPIEADRAQLELALINLAANAGDAMPDGGGLVLELSNTVVDDEFAVLPPGRYVLLTVADSGSGMTADVLERAFVPFFSTKVGGDGAGLGLATVYGTVTQAGGDIAVASEPGIGTSVTIRLPAGF